MIFDKEDYKAFDPELWNAIDAEAERQQNNIELIASENVVSKAVMAAQGTLLTNKYAESLFTKKAIQVNVTMVVQPLLMWLRPLPLNVLRNFLGQNLLTCNLTQVAKPMLLFTCL